MPSQASQNESRTLRVLDYEIDEKYGLVLLKVQDITPGTDHDRQFLTLVYASTDELVAQFCVHTRGIPKKDIINFLEKLKARPWPLTIVLQPTVTMVNADDIKNLSLKDWKSEIDRVKRKDWDKTPLNVSQLQMNNEKLLKGHAELDQYPYHEILKKIEEGTL